MKPLQVLIRLKGIHCIHAADAVPDLLPYLWVIYFKIDGDTTHIDENLSLQGVATVISPSSGQGSLTSVPVQSNRTVPILPWLGEFQTELTPIPLKQPIDSIQTVAAGVIGCAVILMEEDLSLNSDVINAYDALSKAVQAALDQLIPTISINRLQQTPEDSAAIADKVKATLERTIQANTVIWEGSERLDEIDDKLGQAIFCFSQQSLVEAATAGFPLNQRWKTEGEWELDGHISGSTAPLATDDPSGFVTLNTRRHVVYQGKDGYIYELFNRNNQWSFNNLTQLAQAPPEAHSDLFGTELGEGEQIVYWGKGLHIYELFNRNRQWGYNDLTQLAQAPRSDGAPFVYTTLDGMQHVLYQGEGRHIYELFSRDEGWGFNNLTQLAQAPLAINATHAPFHYTLFPLEDVHRVVYRGEGKHIYELFSHDEGWGYKNLTQLAQAPLADSAPIAHITLNLFFVATKHVVYRGEDRQIYELVHQQNASDGSWSCNNLTQLAQAPLADGDPLSYLTVNNVQHIVYRGIDNHLYELVSRDDGWDCNNLTQLAGAPRAYGNPSDYKSENIGEHIVYRDQNGHLYELFKDTDGWKFNVLTLAAM